MLKVLLVDDEPIITTGLKKLIDWENLDLVIVGVARDGEEALVLVDELAPDVVITDLLMQGMDGIAFIKKMNETGYGCKIIILSGHGEFEYAREALKHNVFEYLLKPISPELLTNTLIAVSKSIKEEHETKKNRVILEQKLTDSIPVLQEKFMWELIEGRLIDSETIIAKSKVIGIDIATKGVVAICVSIENADEIEEFKDPKGQILLSFAINNIIVELAQLRNKSFCVNIGNNYYVLLLETSDLRIDNAFSLAETIRDNLKNYLGLIATIGIGKQYKEFIDLAKSVNDAQIALKNKFFHGKGSINHISDPSITKIGHMTKNNFSEELLEKIEYNVVMDPNETAKKLIDNFKQLSNNDMNLIYIYCHEFFIHLKSTLNTDEFIMNPLPSSENLENNIRQNPTIHELQEWITKQMKLCFVAISNANSQRENDVIYEAKKYIDKNFADHLTLREIANMLHMSPSYFCTLFKARTGVGYHEYVLQIRMDLANKLLLSKGLKIYEVSLMVGYRNPRYFSEAYKKYFGVIPREVKNEQ